MSWETDVDDWYSSWHFEATVHKLIPANQPLTNLLLQLYCAELLFVRIGKRCCRNVFAVDRTVNSWRSKNVWFEFRIPSDVTFHECNNTRQHDPATWNVFVVFIYIRWRKGNDCIYQSAEMISIIRGVSNGSSSFKRTFLKNSICRKNYSSNSWKHGGKHNFIIAD